MNNERKSEIQKFEYLENKKSFLDEIKSIFYNYLRAIICWKKKKKKKNSRHKFYAILEFYEIPL